MRKLSLATAFIALLVAISAFAVYETGGASQHRGKAQPTQPAQPSQPSQPSQASQPPREPRPAPQAQPRGGHTAPADAPKTGQAVPRAPEGGVARHEPDGEHRPPRRGGPIVIPYPIGPWWGYPYPGDVPPYGWRTYGDWQVSLVRLDVEPNDAQVYVDRFYAGVVDDFDGVFQHLALRAGSHLIEIRKTGFVALAIELNLYPGQSITMNGYEAVAVELSIESANSITCRATLKKLD
jgi:hypothetical protein